MLKTQEIEIVTNIKAYPGNGSFLSHPKFPLNPSVHMRRYKVTNSRSYDGQKNEQSMSSVARTCYFEQLFLDILTKGFLTACWEQVTLKTYSSIVKLHVSQEASFGLAWTSLHAPESMKPYILHVSVLLSCQHTALKPNHRALCRHWTGLMTDVRQDKQHTTDSEHPTNS